MRTRLSSLLLVVGADAAALAIAVPASAAGFNVSGGTSWTATSTNAKLTDNTSGTSFSCPVAAASGGIKNGTGLPGTAIGTVTSATFGTSASKCTGPLARSYGQLCRAFRA